MLEVFPIRIVKGPSTGQDLKILNRILVRDTIRKLGPISRHEISHKTGLTPSTITVITSELIKQNIIKETGYGDSRGGRRPILLELNPKVAYILAVRIQKGEVLIGLFDLACNILSKQSYAFDSISPEEFGQIISDSFNWLCQSNNIDPKKVLWCSIASPGLIDSRKGVVVRSSNLNWHNVNLKDVIAKKLHKLTIHIEQNVKAASLAELEWGCARGYSNFIYLNLSVGISAAFVINGNIFSGEKGFAGEIGHSVLYPENGPLCSCGRNGCFEAACGVNSIIKRVKKDVPEEDFLELSLVKDKITIDDIVTPPLSENATVRRILTEVGYLIGICVGNLLNSFNTNLVILGGDLAKAGEVIIDPITQCLKERVLDEIIDEVRILNSRMHEDPQLLGAAALALQKTFAMEDWDIQA
mgnify:CR=1 FL=1